MLYRLSCVLFNERKRILINSGCVIYLFSQCFVLVERNCLKNVVVLTLFRLKGFWLMSNTRSKFQLRWINKNCFSFFFFFFSFIKYVYFICTHSINVIKTKKYFTLLENRINPLDIQIKLPNWDRTPTKYGPLSKVLVLFVLVSGLRLTRGRCNAKWYWSQTSRLAMDNKTLNIRRSVTIAIFLRDASAKLWVVWNPFLRPLQWNVMAQFLHRNSNVESNSTTFYCAQFFIFPSASYIIWQWISPVPKVFRYIRLFFLCVYV